jgi:transcriptional regulator with XRE-family HTH domain
MNTRAQKQTEPAESPRVGPVIRNLRRRQDRTLQDLADATGLSVGFLSQIEREIATPSLSALAKIARALGVEIEHFIASPSADSIHTKAELRETYWVDRKFMTYERLSADFPGSVLSAFIVTMPPRFVSEPDSHDGEEFIYQLEGSTVVEVDGEKYVLNTGDTLHFRSSRSHLLSNPSDQKSKISWVGTSQVLRRLSRGSGNDHE